MSKLNKILIIIIIILSISLIIMTKLFFNMKRHVDYCRIELSLNKDYMEHLHNEIEELNKIIDSKDK